MVGRSDRPGRAARQAGQAQQVAAANARPARSHRAGRNPFAPLVFIPPFLALAALYLVALYSGHPEFAPFLGAGVLGTAVAYWVSVVRVIAYRRMIVRRARRVRVLAAFQGGAR
ncbi:hypothetical protein [Nocardia cyriacigeorgica]|uniref:hypothetical protein n=1 Tax=Nocardia cyriacigeorgica TaxID=135487 RepID=UPI002454C16D|nr:hypothetical protein [Nocardia cyriacigeorgica]